MGRDHTDTWFFFGDSVTLGVNDNVTPGGFVSRLALKGAQKGLYEFPPATFYNLGARRQTMAQIQDRFKREYEARLMPGIRSRFAFCTGTVDALRGTAPEAMAENLAGLLNEAKGIAPTLFICPRRFSTTGRVNASPASPLWLPISAAGLIFPALTSLTRS